MRKRTNSSTHSLNIRILKHTMIYIFLTTFFLFIFISADYNHLGKCIQDHWTSPSRHAYVFLQSFHSRVSILGIFCIGIMPAAKSRSSLVSLIVLFPTTRKTLLIAFLCWITLSPSFCVVGLHLVATLVTKETSAIGISKCT